MTTPQWALERIQRAKDNKSTILDLSRKDVRDFDLEPLKEIPDGVLELKQLTELDLGHNRFTDLSERIATLPNLTSLDLGGNRLIGLPEGISKLQSLTTLRLYNNQLTSLPEIISKLQNLTSLDLGGNRLTNLPDGVSKLQHLTKLYLHKNQLTSLPEAVSKLQNLTELYLGGNRLPNIPESIIGLQNLEALCLDSNRFIIFPESITGLQNLKALCLHTNRLTSLPEAISKLQNLIELYLHNNQITSLPEAISKLQSLKKLDLNNNQIISLPESIHNLQNLTTLNLRNNQLTSLSEAISKLQSLTELDLNDNQLVSLPESIHNLQKLTTLNLRNNRLTSLPKSITKLQKLKALELQLNSLVTPPQEVARIGFEAICKYFDQLAEQGQDQLYEAKLLILGEGGAGKTTLAKKIENPDYVLQDEKLTEGVDVTTWVFPIEPDRSFRVNIWDFGGQEIYHATHQFFLTKRSLYVLVADTRKEDTDFYYWLNVVSLLSENSPLLIIQNEKQGRLRELNKNQLRGQFENLKEVLATNLANNSGLDKVKSEIEHYLKNLPHIGSPLPKTWVRVRERLEKDVRNHIPLRDYLDICAENGITEDKDSLQLSNYLHDIGVFLHFQDELLLKKIVILKPKWGTDAVYKLLDNQIVIKNMGRFSRADLNMVWDAPEYEDMRDELLQLMMKFKLCYEIPAHKGMYIAPQLLTGNQPEYDWDEEENLLLRYTYEFMPRGILLRFIVAMSENIWQQTIWKSGVILEKDKTRAEVIEYYGKCQIHVRVAGAHKKELLTIVIYELDKIHATYKRLKCDKLIPCNCTKCKTEKEPYFYHLEVLQKFIEDRQYEIQCQQSYKMVSVRSLIDDVLEREDRNEEHDSPMVQYIIHGDYIDQGEKKMTHISQTIKDSTIEGSIIAAESIKDSFNVIEKANIPDDLKEQIKQLNQAVGTMIKELPKEKAEEVADDMKRLADEATKEKPNPKWYTVSIEGLTKAAEKLGKVGEPVLELTGKVLKLLAVG